MKSVPQQRSSTDILQYIVDILHDNDNQTTVEGLQDLLYEVRAIALAHLIGEGGNN